MAINKNKAAGKPSVAQTAGQKAAATKAAKKAASTAEVKKEKAAPPVPAKKAAAVKAPPAEAAPAKATTAATADEPVSRKKLATTIQQALHADGKGAPLSIVEQVLVGFEKAVGEALAAGNSVVLPGFGKFIPQDKPARTGRNPTNGEAVQIAASRVPRFKPGTQLKATVKGQ